MAVDTRNKRASILGLGLAAVLTLPLTDGTVGQGDRQQVALSYAGIAAGIPYVVSTAAVTSVSGDAVRDVSGDVIRAVEDA